jgi:hypothetical protein
MLELAKHRQSSNISKLYQALSSFPPCPEIYAGYWNGGDCGAWFARRSCGFPIILAKWADELTVRALYDARPAREGA